MRLIWDWQNSMSKKKQGDQGPLYPHRGRLRPHPGETLLSTPGEAGDLWELYLRDHGARKKKEDD